MATSQLFSNQIANGTLTNSDFSNDPADKLSGSKVDPSFGGQAISTSSSVTCASMFLGIMPSDPVSPSTGQIRFNGTDKQFKGYNGTDIVILG